MNIQERIIQLDIEIGETFEENLNITKFSSSKSQSPTSKAFPTSLFDFYNQQSHLNYEWETKEIVNSDGQKLMGRINILDGEEVLHDWQGLVYFKDRGDTSIIKDFKPVDFFVPEACAGFLLNEQNSDAMYYLDLGDNELKPLNVDFNGYLELMFLARGFWYWQRAVLNIVNKGGYGVETEQFKTYMPQIFPDFKWEDFVALYEKVKIK